MKYKLKILSHFWNKDSNILFDYESENYTSTNVTITSSGYLYRQDKKLIIKKEYENSCDYIASITKKADEYQIHTNDQNELIENKEKTLDEKLWIIVKSTHYDNKEGHRLREGDKIKLGKVMFKVRELKSDDMQETLKNEPKTLYITHKHNLNTNFCSTLKLNANSNKPKGNPICRICLGEDNDPDDPMINPCACTGSVRFIHLNCLRRWLNSKIISKSYTFLTVHTYKNFECELCKGIIPERIKFKNEIISLVEYNKPESNYIVLESISREKRENKYIYIIHMKNRQTVRLGRSNESDVRLTDISVSRNHAVITLNKGRFYIKDNSSKFGTSVQLQNEIIAIPGKQIAVQSSKLFIIFSSVKTCLSWITCYYNKRLANSDYNTYLADKLPYYYMKELEGLDIIDSNYTIFNNEYASSASKKSEINDKISNVIEAEFDLQNNRNQIKESRTANEESILGDLHYVVTRNIDNIRSPRSIHEEIVHNEILPIGVSNNNVQNSINITLRNTNNLNIISKDERESDFLLDRFNRRRNSKEEIFKKRNKILDKSKTKGAENVTADYDITKTIDNIIDVTPVNQKKKISLKNPKVGIESYGYKRNILLNNLDYSSVTSEKLILKENKVKDEKIPEVIDIIEYNHYKNEPNNSLNPNKIQSNSYENIIYEDEKIINVNSTENIIDKIFMPSEYDFAHDDVYTSKIKNSLNLIEGESTERRSKNKTHTNNISQNISKINMFLVSHNNASLNNNFFKHSSSDPSRSNACNRK